MSYSTKELIGQIRSQIQEKNQSALSDADILSMLNRGQDYAINIMARRYVEPLLKSYTPVFDADSSTPIPDDAFEQRVLGVEIDMGSYHRELDPIPFDKAFEFNQSTSTASSYAVIGNRVHVYPQANSNKFKIWYLRSVPELIPESGRIISFDDPLPYISDYAIVTGANNVVVSGVPTSVGDITRVYRIQVTNAVGKVFQWSNDGGANWTTGVVWVDDVPVELEENITVKFLSTTTHVDGDAWSFNLKFINSSITLDSIGPELSTTGAYSKYVNIIDFNLGTIKATMEITDINTDTGVITFKDIPSRSRVLNRDISGSIPSNVELDDYICPVRGSCVLFFKQPMFNFVLQFAVAEARRSLGYDVVVEENKLNQMEKQIEKLRSNRPAILKVKMNNPRWR